MKKILIGCLLAMFAVPAVAQEVDQLRLSGNGRLIINNRDQTVRNVTVTLQRSGRATIVVSANRNETLTGSWYSRRDGEVDIEIQHGFGSNDTNGNGRITFTGRDRRQISSLYLSGRSNNNRWSLDFESGRNPGNGNGNGNGWGNRFEMSARQDVRGTANIRGRLNINRANVNLSRDGSFMIEISGTQTRQIRGQWDMDRSGRITLDIRQIYGAQDVDGDGTITLTNDRRAFTRIELDGRLNGRERFDVSITSNDFNNDNGNDPIQRPIDVSTSGAGSLLISGVGSTNVRSVRIDLDDRQSAFIEIRGDRTVQLTGTWRVMRNGEIEVTIEDGFGREGARGSAQITLNSSRTNVTKLIASGQTSGRNFSVNFTARN